MNEAILKQTLTGLFVIATLMGPGPGLYLLGSKAGEGPALSFAGIPALYAWVSFWFLVQAAIILVASRKVWALKD
jgi:hypothetical protein